MWLMQISVCVMVAVTGGRADTFTSIKEMEYLFDLEQTLVVALDNYLTHAQFEMDVMEAHYKELEKIESEIQDADDYAANPVNAFSVVKRMVRQWPATFQLLSHSPFIDEEDKKDVPDEASLQESIASLVAWQQEKGYKTETIARGWVEGIRPHANLTAEDCYEIAAHCYHHQQRQLAAEWLAEALYKMSELGDASVAAVPVLELTFLARCLAGDVEGSVAAYQTLSSEAAQWYSPSRSLTRDYKSEQVKQCKAAALKAITDKVKAPSLVRGYDWLSEPCRAPAATSDLDCYRMNFGDPYLLLGPAKLELLNKEPVIVLIHEVIGHDQILDLKEQATINLKTLEMKQNGPVKIAKGSLSRQLNRKMVHYTDDDEKLFSEALQATVFGPGGRYQTMRDLQPDAQKTEVAKIIYFLTDVPRGGHTVFPTLRLVVPPLQGSALFWYGAGELERGECPVILGSKWVVTHTLTKKEKDEDKE